MHNKLISQFNLPSYIRNKSFAEASKLIQKKFVDRDDKVSQDTMNALLGRLRDAQESVKQQSEPETPTNQQSYGGFQNTYTSRGLVPDDTTNSTTTNNKGGKGMGMIGSALNTAGTALMQKDLNPGEVSSIAGQGSGANAAIDGTKDAVAGAIGPFGQLFRGIQKLGQGAGSQIGGEAGAGIADAFSPEESTIEVYKDKDSTALDKLGQWVPGLGGVIAYRNRQDKMNKQMKDDVHSAYNTSMSTYAKGGYMNKYSDKDLVPPYMTSNRGGIAPLDFSTFSTSYDKNGASRFGANENNAYFDRKLLRPKVTPIYTPQIKGMDNGVGNNINELKNTSVYNKSNNETVVNNDKSKVGSFLDNNKGALRYAPIAMNAYQLATMKKPEVESLNRLDNRYKPQYVDERRLMNSINEGFGAGYATEGSGGSLARYNTSARASQLNKTKAVSDAYIKASDVNRSEDKTAQSFNKATDTFNIGQSNREKDINAKNRAAYDTNKSRLLSQIGTDIGQIGKEYLYKDQAENIFGYDWKGKYKKENPNATKAETEKAYKEAVKLKKK